jgi:hypothetical protein
MPKTDTEKLKTEIAAAQAKGDSHVLKQPIPVLATLDNGETYKGMAVEVRPDGLVMVQTGNCDLGIQLSHITCTESAKVPESDL